MRIAANPPKPASPPGGHVSLGFAMPVALPPAGEYEVRVAAPGSRADLGCTVSIDQDVVLSAPVPVAERYALTFWSGLAAGR